MADFYMSKYEVSQELFRSVMNVNPSVFKGANLPVENVSWLEAVEFCNALSRSKGRVPVYTVSYDKQTVSWNRVANGFRLPTEAEWEYACRAGSTTPFYTKKTPSASEVNFYGHYPYQIEQNYFDDSVLEAKPGEYRGKTVELASFKTNPFGLYDMHGNVAEWCFDYYGEYSGDETNPAGEAVGTRRVNRGGGWNDFGKNLRSAYRAASPQASRAYNIGFRLVANANDSVKGTFVSKEASSKTVSNKTLSKASRGKKALIVFFSWSGNTQLVAREIKKQTGFDIVELELASPYLTNYNTVLNEAQRDQHNKVRPSLKTKIANFESYEMIILGYPNWWASIPMPIATLLESYDFSGKSIAPFCSHGGGRFGQSLTAIAKLAPNAKLLEGLSVHYSGGARLSKDVEEWLKKVGVGKK